MTTVDARAVSFEPVTVPIGAEVSGVDLASELSDDVIEALRLGVHQYGVLFLRDQHLEDETHVAVARRFGPLYRHPLRPDDASPVFVLDSGDPSESAYQDHNTGWHSDATFEERPPYLAFLRAVLLPAVGGDTLWASANAVYDGLSSKNQRLLDGMEAMHDPHGVMPMMGLTQTVSKARPQPIVVTDPLTGRKAIYVNPNYVSHVIGMSERESRGILSMLYDMFTAPEYQVRFRWRPGSVAIWHERNTQHNGVGGYKTRRIMHRVIATGDPVA